MAIFTPTHVKEIIYIRLKEKKKRIKKEEQANVKAKETMKRQDSSAKTRESKRLKQLPSVDYAKMVSYQISDSDSEEDDQVCGRCGEYDPLGSSALVEWLQCETCKRWYHSLCECPNHYHGAAVVCGRC